MKQKVFEMLGVKPNEKFRLKGETVTNRLFRITNELEIETLLESGVWKYGAVLLTDIILGKVKIIRIKQPLLTEEEKQFLKKFIFRYMYKSDDYLIIDYEEGFNQINLNQLNLKFNGLINKEWYTSKELGL